MKSFLLIICCVLAGCETVPEPPRAPVRHLACPELPLMRADQTPRQYALVVVDLYNNCRDSALAK